MVMMCMAMQALPNNVHDIIESELLTSSSEGALIEAAARWWVKEQERGRTPGVVPARSCERWPVLSAWRWLINVPDREHAIGQVTERSGPGTQLEGPSDLAHRAIMPKDLARALVG